MDLFPFTSWSDVSQLKSITQIFVSILNSFATFSVKRNLITYRGLKILHRNSIYLRSFRVSTVNVKLEQGVM